MLKASKQSFRFDQNQIRFNLLKNIDKPAQFESKPFFSYKLATVFAALILFIGLGTTFAFANAAKPGDKLFAIDTLQEKMLLKLPWPEETKASIRTRIVHERIAELNEITKKERRDEIKLKAIDASGQSLNKAIESTVMHRDKLKKRGKTERAAKLNETLNKLEELASKQEMETDRIKQNVTDPEVRNKIDERIEEIQNLRNRVRAPDVQKNSEDLKNLLK